MRLDKFLKLSRLIKRRTIAKEVCDNNRVFINGKQAKASSIVNINDIIVIRVGDKKEIRAKVKTLIERPKKEESFTMYEIIEWNKEIRY